MATLTIYILYSTKRNLFYVGKTKILEQRLKQHNTKESVFTKSGTPWHLLWFRTFTDTNEAEALERKLKNLSRTRKIKFMKKYHEGLVDQSLLHLIE
jgi:putative endonuclease